MNDLSSVSQSVGLFACRLAGRGNLTRYCRHSRIVSLAFSYSIIRFCFTGSWPVFPQCLGGSVCVFNLNACCAAFFARIVQGGVAGWPCQYYDDCGRAFFAFGYYLYTKE